MSFIPVRHTRVPVGYRLCDLRPGWSARFVGGDDSSHDVNHERRHAFGIQHETAARTQATDGRHAAYALTRSSDTNSRQLEKLWSPSPEYRTLIFRSFG